MTLDQAKSLQPGDVLHHVSQTNADGTPQRWRVSGAVKTWKTDPSRVRVPVKFGLRHSDAITETNLHLLVIPE